MDKPTPAAGGGGQSMWLRLQARARQSPRDQDRDPCTSHRVSDRPVLLLVLRPCLLAYLSSEARANTGLGSL